MALFICTPSVRAQDATDGKVAGGQSAQSSTALNELLARYPAGSIHTSDDASRAGEDVHKMRVLIDAQFADEQKACFQKFFATSCLNDAKGRHRIAAAKVRSIEIEVNKFKRHANVMARDKALAAKQDKNAAELVNHEKESRAASMQNTSGSLPGSPTSSPVKSSEKDEKRTSKHHVDVRKEQKTEAELEKQRASHIAAFEKKQQESEARQREVAAKKLEKARAHSNNAASESK